MVQVKKIAVEQAILDAAEAMFRARGFSATPMAAIARRAGVAVSTIYVYYGSKLELFFAIYEPWLTRRFDDMSGSVAGEATAFGRVRSILDWIWVAIPSSDNFFSNNLIEAISTAGPADRYSDGLLSRIRRRLSRLLMEAVTGAAPRLADEGLADEQLADKRLADEHVADELAFLILMAFDGFSIKVSRSARPAGGALLDLVAGMICARLGVPPDRPAAVARPDAGGPGA